MTGRGGGADSALRAPERPTGGDAGPRSPWLIVVARGHPRLMAEIEAIFRDHPRVQVSENRRRDRALLPRPDAGSHGAGASAGNAGFSQEPSTQSTFSGTALVIPTGVLSTDQVGF